jgi:hypothetical protein
MFCCGKFTPGIYPSILDTPLLNGFLFLPRRPGFDPLPIYVGFVARKVDQRRVLLRVVPPVSVISLPRYCFVNFGSERKISDEPASYIFCPDNGSSSLHSNFTNLHGVTFSKGIIVILISMTSDVTS